MQRATREAATALFSSSICFFFFQGEIRCLLALVQLFCLCAEPYNALRMNAATFAAWTQEGVCCIPPLPERGSSIFFIRAVPLAQLRTKPLPDSPAPNLSADGPWTVPRVRQPVGPAAHPLPGGVSQHPPLNPVLGNTRRTEHPSPFCVV